MRRITTATAALMILAVAARTRAGDAHVPQAPTPQTNPTAFTKLAEEAIERVCASCHGWDIIADPRRTSDDWDRVLRDMVAQGARGTAAEMSLIRGYVLWSYGRVAVNTAPADELTGVLGVQPEIARAIVEYREQHGAFRNVDDLAKVPGLDRQVLVAQADALQFDVKGQSR